MTEEELRQRLYESDVCNAWNAGVEAQTYYISTPGLKTEDIRYCPLILEPVAESLENYELTVEMVETNPEMFLAYYKGLIDGYTPAAKLEAMLT